MKIRYSQLVIATICASAILTSLLYCLGFSKTFSVIDKYSPSQNPFISEMHFDNDEQKALYSNGWFPKQSEKIFLYVIDNLSFDQVIDKKEKRERLIEDKNEEITKQQTSNFTSITERLNNEINNSILLRGNIDTQYVSVSRIKALATGTIPSFTSIFDQISGEESIQDNLFYQLKKQVSPQESIYLYGVDIWNQYYEKYFDFQYLNENQNSQKMFDDSIEINEQIIQKYLNSQTAQNWTFFINHDGGINSLMNHEVIQKYDKLFESPLYEPAIEVCNNYTKKFIDGIDNNTTFILISYHGFTNQGTQVDKEIEEKPSVIFGYDKRGFIKEKKISQIMNKEYENQETDQIDILATMCMLKGIAIPSNNIGVIIPDFFLNQPQISNTVIANAYYTNMRQIEEYFDEGMDHHSNLNKNTYNHIKDISNEIKQSYQKLFSNSSESNTDEQLASFISSVIHLSKIAKEASRNEGQSHISYMYFSLGAMFIVLFASIAFVFYNDTIISHGYTSQDKHITESLLVKFLIGSFFFHIAIFFLFSGFNVLLLLNFSFTFILFLFFADSIYSRYKLNNKPKHLLKDVRWFSTFKLDTQTFIFVILLCSFAFLFKSVDTVDELDYHIFIITSIILAILSINLVLKKGRVFSSKMKIFFQILIIGSLSYFCMYLNPFVYQDKEEQELKTRINTDFIHLLTNKILNTIVPLIFFNLLQFRQILQTLNSSKISKKSKFFFYLTHIAIQSMITLYFVAKNFFSESLANNYLINSFSICSLILVILQIIYMSVFEQSTLFFIQKYKLFLKSIIPQLLYLMEDHQCITLVIFFFITISLFHNVTNYLSYRPYSLVYSYLTILSFQYFYVSGHKFNSEFMYLHEHTVGIFVHRDFLSNIHLFVGNYSFFFLAFLYFPIVLSKDTLGHSHEYGGSGKMDISEQKSQFEVINDSLFKSHDNIHAENDQDDLIESQNFDQMMHTKQEESNLTHEQLGIKEDLAISKTLIYLNLPLILSLIVSFFRNIFHYYNDKHQEQSSTIIVFLTTIFLISSIFAQIHFLLSIKFRQSELRRRYLEIH